MKLLQAWKPEIVELINTKNGLTLVESDVELSMVDTTDGAVHVKVTPANGSKYFNAQTLVYVPRDLSKAFLGLNIRFIVNSDTTIRKLVEMVSARYGIPFDQAVDFAQAELDKVVDFSESGVQDVEIPVAATSYVWIGKLNLTVSKDGLDLETLIKNIDLSELTYLNKDGSKGSLELLTVVVDWSSVYAEQSLGSLTVGASLTTEQATAVVNHLVTKKHLDAADAPDLVTALGTVNVVAADTVGESKVIRMATITTTNWKGQFLIIHAEALGDVNINDVFASTYSMNLDTIMDSNLYGSRPSTFATAFVEETITPFVVLTSVMTMWMREDGRGYHFTDEQVATINQIAQLAVTDSANFEIVKQKDSPYMGYKLTVTGKKALRGEMVIHVFNTGLDYSTVKNVTLATMNTNPTTPEMLEDRAFQAALFDMNPVRELPVVVAAMYRYDAEMNALVLRDGVTMSDDGSASTINTPDGVTIELPHSLRFPRTDLSQFGSSVQPEGMNGALYFDFMHLVNSTSGPALGWFLPAISMENNVAYGTLPGGYGNAQPDFIAWNDVVNDIWRLAGDAQAQTIFGLTSAKLTALRSAASAIINVVKKNTGEVYIYRDPTVDKRLRFTVIPSQYSPELENVLEIVVDNVPIPRKDDVVTLTPTQFTTLSNIIGTTYMSATVVHSALGGFDATNYEAFAGALAGLYYGSQYHAPQHNLRFHEVKERVGEAGVYDIIGNTTGISLKVV